MTDAPPRSNEAPPPVLEVVGLKKHFPIRKGLLRRRASGISVSMPRSKAATVGSACPGAANHDHTAAMSSRLVVSSKAMPTWRGDTRRRLAPLERARASTASVAPPVSTVRVSKACGVITACPSAFRPSARMAM